ncbi:MAG: cupredoxin domain-containing protein [Sphingomicrobium sp.]
MTFSRLATAALLSILALGPATAQPAPQAVTIGVFSFGFTPHPIHLRAGQPVTLTFVNQSGSGHDFTATSFFASSTITGGAAPGGKIPLAGHQTKSITLVPRAGTYAAHCSHFLHSSMGMTDQIIVN